MKGRSQRWRAAGATAALLVVALVAAGCGLDRTVQASGADLLHGLSPSAALAAASEQATPVTSGRFTYTVSLDKQGTGSVSGDLVATGAFDVPRRQSSVEVDMSSMLRQAKSAASDSSDAKVTEAMTKLFGDGHFAMVQDGDTSYLRFPMFAAMLGTSKPWIKSTAATGGLKVGPDVDTGPLTQAAGLLDIMRKAGTVTEVGHEAVRGVPTTHYHAVVDLRKVAETTDPKMKPLMDKTFDALSSEADLFKALPIDVWLDSSGHLRRYEQTYAGGGVAPGTSTGAPGRGTLRMELYDLNRPVKIAIPPASQVADEKDLQKGMGGMFGGGGTDPSSSDDPFSSDPTSS